jgi:hypothetical protein
MSHEDAASTPCGNEKYFTGFFGMQSCRIGVKNQLAIKATENEMTNFTSARMACAWRAIFTQIINPK